MAFVCDEKVSKFNVSAPLVSVLPKELVYFPKNSFPRKQYYTSIDPDS